MMLTRANIGVPSIVSCIAYPKGCKHSITLRTLPVKKSAESLAVATGLHLIEGGVMTSPDHEVGVAACFDDATTREHQNLVSHPHRREAVADQQRRLPSDELAEMLKKLVFGLGVQR